MTMPDYPCPNRRSRCRWSWTRCRQRAPEASGKTPLQFRLERVVLGSPDREMSIVVVVRPNFWYNGWLGMPPPTRPGILVDLSDGAHLSRGDVARLRRETHPRRFLKG